MASGDVVGVIVQSLPPAANRADPGIRAGGSSPAENWPIISYDDTADEYWDFLCALESPYSAGSSTGLTIEIPWMSEDQTTGDVQWEIGIRRLTDDAEDLDGSHSYAFNTVADTAASAAGELSYPTITFTDGTDMDSVAENERFMMRVKRDGSNTSGNDDLTNDAQLLWPAIVIRET